MSDNRRRVPAFCPLCTSRCGCEAVVEDGTLLAIEPDPGHPTGQALCAKGRASPELVTAPDRLLYPLRRTRPKGDPDPGWRRISWDEALDETAAALRRIAAESGPEAVAFGVATPGGTSISDAAPWINRLINVFGSPNNCASMELCNWHRDFARAFTTGTGTGTPDYDNAGCILLWGHNPSTSSLAAATKVAAAKARGAKLIVVDPRRAGFAVKADQWLPVRPGTDAAVALAVAGVMIASDWFDHDFTRRWTNGPFLVRDDNGNLLNAADLAGGAGTGMVVWDAERQIPVVYDPAARRYAGPDTVLALDGRVAVLTRQGPVFCRPAFAHFADRCREMPPERAETLSGVPAGAIREAARLLWQHRPVAHFCWTGLEQQSNATQTDRAIAILHALTGSIDVPGGNVFYAQAPLNDVSGAEFRDPEQWRKALGRAERPLGPAAAGWITSDALYDSVLEGQPYRVRAFFGFGTNVLVSHADGARGAAAFRTLDFHVQADMFLTPTASFADIVLPVASAWEREGLRPGFGIDQTACEWVQLRPALVAPRGESRPDTDFIFDLAVRLGFGDRFWQGDVEAAMTHYLAPSGITPAMLRAAPRGVARVALTTGYRKYERSGFNTPSGKVEIYAERLRAVGEPALPVFRAPPEDPTGQFPLLLTSAKTPLFCHSQHRNLPRLRRHMPDPLIEMNPATAASRDVTEGDWVAIRTPRGSVRARARLNPSFQPGIVAAQHGWWQGCEALGLPGHDPFSAEGANINLVIGTELVDPISGAAPHRRYLCEIEKIAVPASDETTVQAAAFAPLGEPALASARNETVG